MNSIMWFIYMVFYVAVPSKNTLYAIAAARVGQEVLANPQIQQLGGDSFKALDIWIRSQIRVPVPAKEDK